MDIFNVHGRFLTKIPYPLSKAGRTLKQLCSSESPNVVFIHHNDKCAAVAKICRDHEIEYNTIVKEEQILPPHTYAQIIGREDRLVIFRSVAPHRFKNFKDALEYRDANIIKSIVAQLIAIIVHAQEKDARFTHNDFKADNILLTSASDYVTIGSYEIKSFGVAVVLIDFETTTGLNFPPFNHDKKLLHDFGISLEFSQWTDLHLVFMEVVRHKIDGFDVFLQKYFHLDIFTPKGAFVTSQNRLNERGRKEMSGVNPKDLLLDSFFNS